MRNYPIDHNWEQAVQSHVNLMQTQHAEMEKHSWETQKFGLSFDAYVFTCENFLDYITAHFESKAGFTDFLKSEARGLFPPQADATRLLDMYNWAASDINAVQDAEKLSEIYIYSYSAVTHAALLHQELLQETAPALRLQSA